MERECNRPARMNFDSVKRGSSLVNRHYARTNRATAGRSTGFYIRMHLSGGEDEAAFPVQPMHAGVVCHFGARAR